MKDQLVNITYAIFADWCSAKEIACYRGCATCCTQNVTITAIEGENILRFIHEQNLETWFAEKLEENRPRHRPKMTTNDFARACLQQRDVDFGEVFNQQPCPFLKQNICRIYPARPFSCRMMVSEKACLPGETAMIPGHYLAAATAVAQIIEHLAQKQDWGNMLDILPALCDIGKHRSIAQHLTTTTIMQAGRRTLTAKPLPGFLFTKEEGKTVTPLLQALFNTEVNGKRIEDILNDKSHPPLSPPGRMHFFRPPP